LEGYDISVSYPSPYHGINELLIQGPWVNSMRPHERSLLGLGRSEPIIANRDDEHIPALFCIHHAGSLSPAGISS
jgi:hypothetical protein